MKEKYNKEKKILKKFSFKKNFYKFIFNLKIVIVFLLFLFYFYFSLTIHQKLKIALCTMGRLENLYVKEFVYYYKKLGIDKIFIYDDNDLNSENINDVNPLKYYAKVFKMKNIIKTQNDAYTHCYKTYKHKYDWFLMIDMDEYLVIVNDTLKNYLSNPIFKKCDFIKFNWIIPTDNNLVHYDNRSLFERFKGPYHKSGSVKTIIRGNINNLLYHVHSPFYSPEKNISCNNVGKIIKNAIKIDIETVRPINIKKAYIIHFQFKSTEEVINKYKRGYRDWLKRKTQKFLYGKIKSYFRMNNITKEKIDYIERELNLNLTQII